MKPSLCGATHFAPAYPAACVITRLARATLVLALIFAATLPSSAGDRRLSQRAVGSVFGWGWLFPDSPTQVSSLSGAVAVADGRHSLILKSDGTVLARGFNDYGQLGDGTTTPSPTQVQTPVQVSGLSDVVAVAVGETHSIALKSDGTVWTWGRNDYGQLGVAGGDQSTPVQVPSLSGVVAIAAGQQHTLALRSDGTVWAWGSNGYGQLGVSGGSSVTPVQVTALSGIVAITAGHWHSVALSSDGTVWAWGYNFDGQLGMGGVSQYYGGTDPNYSSTPQHVMGGSFSGVTKISSLQYHTLAVRSDGTVWAWGANDQWGRLGNGGTSSSGTPVQAAGLSDMVDVAAGYAHGVALKSDGTVWTWGYNGYGQLGNGTRGGTYLTATQVPGLSGVVAISAGVFSSLALQSQAGAMAWGGNVQGALGDGSYVNSSTPVAVAALSGLSAITGGWAHSVALRSDGTVWAWGYNVSGELGDGSNVTRRNTPGQVPRLAGVVAIASGDHHNVALRSDGTVWAWGANESGELGDGSTTNRTQPVQVRGPGVFLSNIVSVACGAFHSIALRSDGTVWAWGANNVGQLGNPSAAYTNQSTPVQVMSGGTALSHLVAIAGGYTFSLALRSDGTVWAWGANSNGEWGTGEIDDWSDVPVQSDISGVVSISAGAGFHSLALLSDGTVRAWGYNAHGQLGDDSILESGTPVQALGLSGGAAVSAGYEHSVALRSDGTVWAWGMNTEGQVGDGTNVDRTAPVSVSTLPAVGAIGVGGLDSFALVDVGRPAPTSWPLTITADNQVITYGGAVPTLGYSLSPSVTPDTPPTCATTATAASPVGTYAITCSGAAKAGYEVTYVSGTLTVNPAPLTIIADNKSMGAGSRVPPLTASYFGFVNGDTAATALSGPPNPTLSQGFDATVPGTYAIALDPVTALNYSIVSVDGQLTVNASALNLFNNFFATGDYAIGVTNLQSGTGTIIVAPPAGGAIPQGAHILAAFLYWQTLESATSAPASRIQFRGYGVLGAQQLGSDIGFTDGALSGVLRTYRANVLPYLPVTLQGLSGTPVDVSMPAEWANGSRHAIGAGLVVVYRVLSNTMPLKAIVLYDGSWVPPNGTGAMNQDIKGFYEAAPGGDGAATAIVNTGTGWGLATLNPQSLSGSDHIALAIPNIAAGAVMVLSTPVNAGADGLLASWKAAHGYLDARDGSWVDLPDALTAGQELYVQIDYMCSVVPSEGTCDTVNGHSHLPKLQALEDVAQAFENHGINVHFDVGNNYQGEPHIVPAAFAKGGNIIPEETCVDTDPANPQCVVPNEPGLVGWKLGLGLAKMGPRDSHACATTGDCSPRFQHGRKDSYHYTLFAHSMATPAWTFANGRLVNISINGGTATITTSVPHYLDDPLPGGAGARITIAEAISQPYLNGIYVPNITGPHTFTIQVKNVAGTISSSTDPALAIYSGKKSSSSGYSDVGGADTVITLGSWKFCLDQDRLTNFCPAGAPQDDSLRVNVQAGTLMHELGHSLGLTHGGTYYQTSGTYLPTYEANCKPNYQGVMNYLFQIDLLGPNHNVLDYSGQALGGAIREALEGNASAWAPTHSTTSWYSPAPAPLISTQSAATRHCDGTPIAPNETMYRWNAAVSSFTWAANQDVNFDGKHDDVMHGYDDWSTYDLRQIGATGSHFVMGGVLLPNGGGVVLPNGGGVLLPNGGGVLLSDGSVVLPNGAGVLLPNGGGVQLPNGGGVLLAGGEVLLPNGGGVLLPNGGGVLLPDGTVVATGGAGVQLPNGGGILLPNGGGVQLPNGGGIVLPNGGGVLLPNGGGVLLANGGGVLLPNGGGVQLPNGGGVLLPNGGGVQLPNGGGILLPNGGGVQLPNGGGIILPTDSGVLLPNGGGILLPNGGGVQLPNGGGIILANGGGVLLPNGGGVLLPNGGGVQLPNGGGVLMPNGGGVLLPNGGGVQLPNGGGILLPNGGGIQLANGGGIQLPNGGGVLLPNGGGILLPNGGGVLLANGGGITLPNGGGVSLPNGGGIQLPNGGGVLFPNGGGVLFPNGGGEEMDYETANSFVRPPYALTKTQTDGGIRLQWQAPNFGVISQYTVYDSQGNSVCNAVGNPPATFCDVAGGSIGVAYLATATIPGENGVPRESQPSEPAKYKTTITFGEPTPPSSASKGSAFPVSVTSDNTSVPVLLTASGVCTIAGSAQSATVTMTASSGICTLTATQDGDAGYTAGSASRQVVAKSGLYRALVLSVTSPLPYMQSEALSTSGGSDSGAVAYSVSGACGLSGNSLTANSGTGSCTVTAKKDADVDYSETEASATVYLAKAAQTITWYPSTPLVVGTPLSAEQLNATVTGVTGGHAPGALTYYPPLGTVLPLGTQKLKVTAAATDDYDSATAEVSVTVQYAGAGSACLGEAGHQIRPPINADGTSVFKARSTVPAKFRVCDANGISIGTAGVVSGFRLVQIISGTTVGSANEEVTATTPDASFRWDSAGQQWVFNISTKNLATSKTYVYEITLNDGTTIPFTYGLK